MKAKPWGMRLMIAGFVLAVVSGFLLYRGNQAKQSMAQLKAAVEASGASWDDLKPKVEHAYSAGADLGHSSEETNNALRAYIERGGDASKATNRLPLAMDVSVGRGMSLTSAMENLALLEGHDAKAGMRLGLTRGELAASGFTEEEIAAAEAAGP